MNWQWYQKQFVKKMDRYVAVHNLSAGVLSETEIAEILGAVAEEMRVTFKLDPETHEYMKKRMKIMTFSATRKYW